MDITDSNIEKLKQFQELNNQLADAADRFNKLIENCNECGLDVNMRVFANNGIHEFGYVTVEANISYTITHSLV